MCIIAKLLPKSFAFGRIPQSFGEQCGYSVLHGQARHGRRVSAEQGILLAGRPRLYLHITCAVQEFRGLEAAMTGSPISQGGAFLTCTEKGPTAESSAPPVNHPVQDLPWIPALLPQLWAAEHARDQSSKLCSPRTGLQIDCSQPVLSLPNGRRRYLGPTTCYTLDRGNANKR